jgi:hypothetical protein
MEASVRNSLVASILGAVGSLGMAVSALLLAEDHVNHTQPASSRAGGLAISMLVAGAAGFLGRTRTPWFAWVSYGAMLPSAIVLLGFGGSLLSVGAFPHSDKGLALLSLAVLAISLPATLIARRRIRARLALAQSNNRSSGRDA